MTLFEELIAIINDEDAHIHHLRSAFNSAYIDKQELQYPETHVSADCRAFAMGCLQRYIRSKNETL